MTDRMTNIKDIVDNFVVTEKEKALIFVLRRALRACTEGPTVSRAYNCQMILESALAKYGESDE